MKRYLVFLLFALVCALQCSAQKSNRSPLLFTDERIEDAKKRVQNDPKMAACWNEIVVVADNALKKSDLLKSDYLALAYQMTKETKYAVKLEQMLLDAVKAKTWGAEDMLMRTPAWRSELNIAHRSFACALAYDAIYDYLSPTKRREIATGLNRLALEPAFGDWLGESSRIHSLNSMGHNWWTACTGMAGLLALSLRTELPQAQQWVENLNEVLPEWFDFAGDVLQQKAKNFDSAGGMYESLNYANYGVQEALLFRLAFTNAYPKRKMEEIAQLKALPNYYIHVCYPRTGPLYSLNFGDSRLKVSAESSMMLLYALGVKSDNMLWYFNQIESGQHRDGYFLNRPMGFIYTPDMRNAPSVPDMKKSQLFADFGWATMRNSWNKDATMLAVKSGHTWNHSHADANSLILFHKGVDIIKDAGNCNYGKAPYREYFFQSQAHNVVMFNGKGQSTEQQYYSSMLRGSLHHMIDAGSLKYILANGTGPMSDNFSRNFRHFLWIDNVIYVVDDMKTHTPGRFEWLWHPGGVANKRGVDLVVTNNNSSVVIRPLFPQMLAPTTALHDYPNEMSYHTHQGPTEYLDSTETYYSFRLPGEFSRIKGVTAIILKDSPTQTELPKIEKREGQNWIGLRIRDKGKITDLYINQLADGRLMHLNSWITADGWTTDAYMFAVSYEEGSLAQDSKELFVCYGSSLRRDEVSYFSSLSKLFAGVKERNGKIVMNIDGQPRVNLSYRTSLKPSLVEVNGAPFSAEYTKPTLKIKYQTKSTER